MWIYLVRHILRYRALNLAIIVALSAYMGFHALQVQMSYEPASLLPQTDSANIIYNQFKDRFGKDGSVLFVGCGVGKTTIAQMVKPLLPFYVAMVLALMLVTYIPWLSEFLPRVFGY